MGATLITALGKVLITILMSLFSETILKRWIVHSLQRLTKLTGSAFDDQLVEDIRIGWGIDA